MFDPSAPDAPAPTGAARLVRRTLGRAARPLLHRALLRGLRPARLPHDPPLERRPCRHGRLKVLRLHGARGQRLAAWLALPQSADPAAQVPAVLALHGWGANASTLWPVVDTLLSSGLAVLLLDAGNHGDSDAEAFSSLPRFAQDLATGLGALRAEPAVDARRIALLGHSVGAAATLLHAARHGDVAAVVSLSAFAHPREMMERWLRAHHLPRRGLGTTILEHVQAVIGTRFDDIAPLNLVPALRCPLLLVHGAHDTTVPLADAHRLHAACPGSALLVVDGTHDLRAALAPHAPRILQFLGRHLGTAAA
ncbi:alpha/beta hydrolase family protein [Piscinibacter defluvii]|uniref:alpha/beta hydrolase family protein n=1 Tax=Piscinibacter defluvii TaxID=1796922 RepID=UPI000FDE15AB|nr:alpha/beta fold hydrolase [Piscinibacter defluvii]